MTYAEAEHRIAKIEQTTSDYEAAHLEEDKLYRDFVNEVSQADSSNSDYELERLKHLAQIVLRSREIDFPRHTA